MDPSVVLSVTGTVTSPSHLTPQAFEHPRYSSCGPSAFPPSPPGHNSSFEYTGQVTQVEPGSVAAPVRTPFLARMLTLVVH